MAYIPSTTVKAKFLKSLCIGTIYKDPNNGCKYIVQEKRINDTLKKTAVPYFGKEDGQELDVSEECFKQLNPKRANIMSVMKNKVDFLEKENDLLKLKNFGSKNKLDELIYKSDKIFCYLKFLEEFHDNNKCIELN